MENQQINIQDNYFSRLRREKTVTTIYLVNGVKLIGKIKSFDKFSILIENNHQEQLIFKHAISTITYSRSSFHRPSYPPQAGGGGGGYDRNQNNNRDGGYERGGSDSGYSNNDHYSDDRNRDPRD